MWKAFQRSRKLDREAKKLFWRAALLLTRVRVMRGFQHKIGALCELLLVDAGSVMGVNV